MASLKLVTFVKLLSSQGSRIGVRSLSTTQQFSAREHVSYEAKGDVGIITFNSPGAKVNVLSQATQHEFLEALDEYWRDNRVFSGVIISGKPGCFIAGADINMLEQCQSAEDGERISREGQLMMKYIEKSPKPIVAAIQGSCMGGGMELALACDYRVAVKDRKTILSQPEVMLGLLPGAGGCVRLPRLIKMTDALDMVLTGKNVTADKAKRMGLVDELVDPIGPGTETADTRTNANLEKAAIAAAQVLALREQRGLSRSPPRTEGALAYLTRYVFPPWLARLTRNTFYEKVVKPKVLQQTAGKYPAPLRIIEVFRASTEEGLEQGYNAEAKAFGELAITPECKALIGLYHGQTATKKNTVEAV